MNQQSFSVANVESFCATWFRKALTTLMAALQGSKKNEEPQQPKDYVQPAANSGVWETVERKVIGDDWC